MKIKNTNLWHDDVRVAALGMRLVKFGEVIEVDDATAELLLIQPDFWSPADKGAREAAAEAIAKQVEVLAAASAAVVMPADPGPEPVAKPEIPETGPEPFDNPSADETLEA